MVADNSKDDPIVQRLLKLGKRGRTRDIHKVADMQAFLEQYQKISQKMFKEDEICQSLRDKIDFVKDI